MIDINHDVWFHRCQIGGSDLDFFLPDAIMTGSLIEEGLGLLVDRGEISAVCSRDAVPASIGITRLEGLLAPGYVEIQINGCGGVIFTHTPTPAAIERMSDVLQMHGVTSFLPTLITAPADVILSGIEAVRAVRDRLPSVLGMHLEGPHLSLNHPGTHDRSLIRPMSDGDLARIVGASDAIRLLTIAGESVTLDQIGALADAGIILALGHTAISAAEVLQAHGRGVHMLTHLYNGMPPLGGRAPGPVGAAFASDTLAASIIVDGFHVDEIAVRSAVRAMGDRLVLTSDATASIEGGAGVFEFGGYRCQIEDGVVRNDIGGLAGAAVLLDVVVQRMAALTKDKVQAIRMASELPARLIGFGDQIGRLAPGLRANFNLLDPQMLTVRGVWAAGLPVAVSGHGQNLAHKHSRGNAT